MIAFYFPEKKIPKEYTNWACDLNRNKRGREIEG